MGAPIGPGDWVECVNARPHDKCAIAALILGAPYQVRDIGPSDSLLLVGVVLPAHPVLGGEYRWVADRFRPIYGRDETLIERLLQKLPADLEPANA